MKENELQKRINELEEEAKQLKATSAKDWFKEYLEARDKSATLQRQLNALLLLIANSQK